MRAQFVIGGDQMELIESSATAEDQGRRLSLVVLVVEEEARHRPTSSRLVAMGTEPTTTIRSTE